MPEKIYDGELDIAVGKSRKETNWRNKSWLWSTLVDKLKTTHYTAETHTEYMQAKKTRQDEIKDIGGFVGGYLQGGRRKSTNVLHRQLITLDIDFSTADFWFDFTCVYGCAAVLYSTHKHAPETPRLRLLIPLDRPVRPDEYEAIARYIAGEIDIEVFDPTTFQPERLMYWPSTSKDGTYLYEVQDGPFVCADDILARYHNWQDSSAWPVSERVDKVLRRDMVKQGDPLEKGGVIGAYCRTHTIHEVIEKHLADVYEPCDIEDRYTYLQGSTAAGLITYDDKFAYSHHGSDPISGKLCNAFDLVRIHKFGLKDEDARENTPSNKLPSYLAMTEYAVKDADVRLLLTNERIAEARGEFAGLIVTDNENQDEAADVAADEEPGEDWKSKLEFDRLGNMYPTINNIVLILENDVAFKNNIAYDDFEKREIAQRSLPWRKVNYGTRFLTDSDDDNIEHYLESVYKIAGTKLSKALSVISERTKFHPICNYLDGLAWDKKPRVDTLFIDYMGAEDSDYTRAVTRKTLCAAVARVFNPGCKFDYMLTFVGPQGLGKSSLIGKLGRYWYSDSFTTVQGKEAFEQVQGVWILEIAELSALRNADVESIKHFITKREDRYRVAYGKRVENFPRQFVPFGSTNKLDFLKDRTGNRRFWPVKTGTPSKDVHTELTAEEVNQIWAEAYELFMVGEQLFLSKELEAAAKVVQENHAEADERIGLIIQYLDTPLPLNWASMSIYEKRSYLAGDGFEYEGELEVRQRVCAAEIYCEVLGGMQKDMSSHNTRFIHEILRAIPGWAEYETRTVFKGYGNQKGYYRYTTVDPKIVLNTTVRQLNARTNLLQ